MKRLKDEYIVIVVQLIINDFCWTTGRKYNTNSHKFISIVCCVYGLVPPSLFQSAVRDEVEAIERDALGCGSIVQFYVCDKALFNQRS